MFRDITDGILDNKKRPMFTQELLQEITENAEATPNTQNTPQFTKVPMASNYPMLMTFDPLISSTDGQIRTPQQYMIDIREETKLIFQKEQENKMRNSRYDDFTLDNGIPVFPEYECDRLTTLNEFLKNDLNDVYHEVKHKINIEIFVNGQPVSFEHNYNLNPGDKISFNPLGLGYTNKMLTIQRKINYMLENKRIYDHRGNEVSVSRDINSLYEYIINSGFSQSERDFLYSYLQQLIDIPFKEANWNSKVSPYAFLYMFFVSESIRIVKQVDPQFDYNRLELITSYDLREKLNNLRLGKDFGFSTGHYSVHIFKLAADIYSYIEAIPSLRASPSMKQGLYSELDKIGYSITRAFNESGH